LHDNELDGNALCAECHRGNHEHRHSVCRDDGCFFIEPHDFDFAAVVDFQEYLGGALTVALSDPAEFDSDSFEAPSSCGKFAPHVRAHLLLCVQLL
jgi:hypothetical protein